MHVEFIYRETANGSLEQMSFIRNVLLDNCGNSGANTCNKTLTFGRVQLLVQTNHLRMLFADSE